MNYNDYDEVEYVRPPDQVVRERLISSPSMNRMNGMTGSDSIQRTTNYNSDFDNQLDTDLDMDIKDVLEQSMLEYSLQEIEKQEQEEIRIREEEIRIREEEIRIREEEEKQLKEEEEKMLKETRVKTIDNFVKKINNLSSIDRMAREIKEDIQPFIDMYIDFGITNMNNDWDDYTTRLVTSYLKSVRIVPSEKEVLKTILSIDI
jgi:molecular chaperone DnaK (HSP70)